MLKQLVNIVTILQLPLAKFQSNIDLWAGLATTMSKTLGRLLLII